MEEEELASSFAAKKENEELKENLKLLKSSAEVSKINIESLVSSAIQKDDYIRVLDDKILDLEKLKIEHEKQVGDLYKKNREMAVFISDLGRFPKFWAKSYQKAIFRFVEKHGLWSGKND